MKKQPISRASELPLVIVRWQDAFTDVDSESILEDGRGAPEFGRLVIVEDVGWLVRKNRQEVVLALSRCLEDNTIRHSTTIPKGMVLEIRQVDLPTENGGKING